MSFLHGVGQATRNPSVVANATDAPALKAQVRSSMARHVGGETGAALLGGIVNGLADTFPPRTCAAAADVLAPLLHCESWHEHAPAWAHASLAALPSTERHNASIWPRGSTAPQATAAATTSAAWRRWP